MAAAPIATIGAAVTGANIVVTVPWTIPANDFGVAGSGTATYTIATSGAQKQYLQLAQLLDEMARDGRATVS